MKKTRITFYLLNISIILIAIIVMFFVSRFSSSSKNSLDLILKENLWELVFGKISVTILSGYIILSVGVIINWLMKKANTARREYIICEFIVITIIGMLFVLKIIFFK